MWAERLGLDFCLKKDNPNRVKSFKKHVICILHIVVRNVTRAMKTWVVNTTQEAQITMKQIKTTHEN